MSRLVVDLARGPEPLTPEEVAELHQPPQPTVEERKAELWEEAKRIRESLTDSPGALVTTPSGVVQSDTKSQQNILGLVQMAVLAQINGAPFSAAFTMADNSVVNLNASQMISLGIAVGQHVEAVYAAARALRVAIDDAEDHEDLNAIDLDAGWP